MELDAYSVFVEACALAMMGLGSLQDVKKREVEDYVWLLAAPPFAVNLYAVVAGLHLVDANTWLVELPILAVMGVLFYYLGLFGGADAKALIALGAAMPQPLPPFTSQIGLFGVTVFDNGVVLAVAYSALFALSNIVKAVFVKGYLGRYAKAPLRTKIGLTLYAYKTTVQRYVRESHKLFLAERPVLREGKIEFEPMYGVRLDSGEEAVNDFQTLFDSGKLRPDDEIWVSQGLPLILFMLIGMLVTPITGDLVYHIIKLFLH